MSAPSDIVFTFPGGTRVEGRVDQFTIVTEQPPNAAAPSPFTLFLTSIGACASYYVQSFCRQRGIAVADIRVIQHNDTSASGMVESIRLEVELPNDFPTRYRDAVVRSAEQCTVKRHLEHPPKITIEAASLASSVDHIAHSVTTTQAIKQS